MQCAGEMESTEETCLNRGSAEIEEKTKPEATRNVVDRQWTVGKKKALPRGAEGLHFLASPAGFEPASPP